MFDAVLLSSKGVQVWLAAIAVIVPTLTVVIGALATRAKVLDSRRADALKAMADIVDRLEKQVSRQDQVIGEQQAAVNRLRDLNDDCRAESAEMRAYIMILHGYCQRGYLAMKAAGMPIEPIPDPPKSWHPAEEARKEADFVQRTVAQNRLIVDELGKQIDKAVPDGPGDKNTPG